MTKRLSLLACIAKKIYYYLSEKIYIKSIIENIFFSEFKLKLDVLEN